MKRNLYFRHVFRRANVLQDVFLIFFLMIASWPRIVLEVFSRKNFGDRYFSLPSALTVFGLLAAFPYGQSGGFSRYGGPSFRTVMEHNVSWYAFLAVFLVFIFLRWREMQNGPSVFDFGRFSLSAGEVHPRFYDLRLGKKSPSIRTIEIWLEPALFFLTGFLLWKMEQNVGALLMVCSVIYSLSYRAAYHIGDNFIKDKIDEMICNEEVYSAFVEELDPSKTRGVHFYGHKPADPAMRRNVADSFMEQDEVAEAR